MTTPEKEVADMNIPGFTADASVYAARSVYRTGGFVHDPAASSVVPQQMRHTCEGRYCDCSGQSDCADMINKKCGGWTRCVVINGTLKCLCEPRFTAFH